MSPEKERNIDDSQSPIPPAHPPTPSTSTGIQNSSQNIGPMLTAMSGITPNSMADTLASINQMLQNPVPFIPLTSTHPPTPSTSTGIQNSSQNIGPMLAAMSGITPNSMADTRTGPMRKRQKTVNLAPAPIRRQRKSRPTRWMKCKFCPVSNTQRPLMEQHAKDYGYRQGIDDLGDFVEFRTN
uniref:Zinc finger protein n=1 Tax=Caenorhabditis tropicalis TaxID=1561998 RepID=A0A1I7UMJ5_9PELO